MYDVSLWVCREEKERAAAAAADAAEAQSAPVGESKEAAEKAAKKLEGNARYNLSPGGGCVRIASDNYQWLCGHWCGHQ